ncbi:hypothetical protein DASC09_039220 [Saccharomycopsis crataegensis]|uniref:C2H2-type domain-containing protein n=1 Tax=Saccharomycopsis crataegensis TaxID=43959 RepID=A0AAV5QP52_9ASCO|nr:hypothetical protein DASC09_039220 [Saccharomycopsis crataegensis]
MKQEGSNPVAPLQDLNGDSKLLCQWDGCETQFHDLDSLVRHLMIVHIKSRQSKYKCEWKDCTRNGIYQPSRFALVSHLRSHTGEKPYYCIIPECLRNFTRSDALGKHIRTVHDVCPTHTDLNEEHIYPWWFHLKRDLLGNEKDTMPDNEEVQNLKSLEFAKHSRRKYYELIDHVDDINYIYDILFKDGDDHHQLDGGDHAENDVKKKGEQYKRQKTSSNANEGELNKIIRLNKQMKLTEAKEQKSQKSEIRSKAMALPNLLNEESDSSQTAFTSPAEPPQRMKLSSILSGDIGEEEEVAKEINIIDQDSENEDKNSNDNENPNDDEMMKLIDEPISLDSSSLKFKERVIDNFNTKAKKLQETINNIGNNDFLKSVYDFTTAKANNKEGSDMKKKIAKKAKKSEEDQITDDETNDKPPTNAMAEGNEDSELDEFVDHNPEAQYNKLKRHYLWNLEINQILEKDLNQLVKEKKKLFLLKEALFDANLKLEFAENDDELKKYTGE